MVKRVVVVWAFAGVLAAAGFASAGETLWTEDAKAAMAKAAAEGKDLLIDFTGSDWCGWCKKLDAEVFSQKGFTSEAPKSFVLLKLDFPRSVPQSEELKKQNAEWLKKYRIEGFPTIVLADAAGRPYAKTGYRPGGVEQYMTHLAELRKIRVGRDAALAKAKGAKGLERAKLLDAALAKIDSSLIIGHYDEVVAEIVKLDSENKASLRNKYGAMTALAKIQAAAQRRDFDGGIALADQALKSYGETGAPAQDILFFKSLCFYAKGEKPKAKAALEAALKAAPERPKAERIKLILERVFKDAK